MGKLKPTYPQDAERHIVKKLYDLFSDETWINAQREKMSTRREIKRLLIHFDITSEPENYIDGVVSKFLQKGLTIDQAEDYAYKILHPYLTGCFNPGSGYHRPENME